MSELAAQLVARVLPHVPARQRVLAPPWTLRYQLALAANWNWHFHTLVFDGVYTSPTLDGVPRFHPLPPAHR